MKIKVVYSEKMLAISGSVGNGPKEPGSPSAEKPSKMVEYLKAHPIDGLETEFVEPDAMTLDDFYRVHDKQFVDDILALKRANGFKTLSKSVCDSLPYTNGSMYTAAKLAKVDCPTVALCSGFHHAEWDKAMGFCTFNGLMVSAAKLIAEGAVKKVAIVDCDMHYGNGTDSIMTKMQKILATCNKEMMLTRIVGPYLHARFGLYFLDPSHAPAYLCAFHRLRDDLEMYKPDVILYQSGADVHINDPYGKVLTTEEMYERDIRMFDIAKSLGIPLAWNLAGGYQVEADGSIDKVLDLHLNTFKACVDVYARGNDGKEDEKETEENRAEREAEESRNEAETKGQVEEGIPENGG